MAGIGQMVDAFSKPRATAVETLAGIAPQAPKIGAGEEIITTPSAMQEQALTDEYKSLLSKYKPASDLASVYEKFKERKTIISSIRGIINRSDINGNSGVIGFTILIR